MKQNKYIERAFEVLESSENEIIEDNCVVDNKYKGYLNSFGSSVIISGIMPTILMYCDKSGEKIKVMRLITKIVDNSNDFKSDKSPWDYYTEHFGKEKETQARKIYTEAATALKLAIRTYPLKEEKKEAKNE